MSDATSYFNRRRAKLLRAFEKELRWFRPELEKLVDPATASAIVDETRSELAQLIDRLRDPGSAVPFLRIFTGSSAQYLALYLALARRGHSASDAWRVCRDASVAKVDAMPRLVRWIGGKLMFSMITTAPYRKNAARSQEESFGGWSWNFVPRSAEFEYGIDYTECAITNLAREVGAAEFAPYLCMLDEIMSERMNWGLKRTETIASGGRRCDFRFRRGAATEVRSTIAPPPETQAESD